MNNTSLLTLSVRYNWIGDDGAKAFAALLLSNNTLRELDISRNRIGSEGTQAVMKSMWHNRALIELNLQLNLIYDKGGLFIGAALAHNTTLQKLDLMDCLVGDAGCVSIFESLGATADTQNEMEARQMRRQKNMGANHRVQVLTATHCNTLQHTATHCSTLQHTAVHWNTLRHADTFLSLIHSPLFSCSRCLSFSLQVLTMSGNEIGDIGAVTVGKALNSNRGLVRLDLSRNRLMDKGATALARVEIVCCSVLQGVVGCCRVLQCVAVCCSVLQSSDEWDSIFRARD